MEDTANKAANRGWSSTLVGGWGANNSL